MKGQGLSLNVVIIAVLCILVLVVLAFILITRSNSFNTSVQTCNGVCAFSSNECAAQGMPSMPVTSCSDDTGVVEGARFCCIG